MGCHERTSRDEQPSGKRMSPTDGRKPSPEELRQSTPFLPARTMAITTNRLANAPNLMRTPMHLHTVPPRSDPTVQIYNANPRSTARPANQRIRNASLPTHTEWTMTAIGSHMANPTNFAAVFTTKARLYTLRCLCTKALRNTLRCIRAKVL